MLVWRGRLSMVSDRTPLLGRRAVLAVEVIVMVMVMALLDRRVAGRTLRLRLVVGPHCPALVAFGLCGHLHAAMGHVYHAHDALGIMVDDLDDLHDVTAC